MVRKISFDFGIIQVHGTVAIEESYNFNCITFFSYSVFQLLLKLQLLQTCQWQLQLLLTGFTLVITADFGMYICIFSHVLCFFQFPLSIMPDNLLGHHYGHSTEHAVLSLAASFPFRVWDIDHNSRFRASIFSIHHHGWKLCVIPNDVRSDETFTSLQIELNNWV